ncbi:MAG: glutamate mutase L [Planctomycetaceae bacterium]|nr:glutamate mutase L [Planctomycetaceae bacterium]
MYDYLIIDIGSTYTKQRLIDNHRLVATCQTPTSLDDVRGAIRDGRERMAQDLGKLPEAARVLASSSAAGGLRMVAMGYMARVTARAAKEVAMNSGAKILEIISSEDPPDYRVQILMEIRPDIILLAGGTDYGDEESAVENAKLIIESKVGAMVIIACNIVAQPTVAALLEANDVPCVRVPNIMPTIHKLNVDKARHTIHREFIKQITKAPGLVKMQAELTDEQVIPTPGAVLLASELLAKGVYNADGVGGVIVVDMGGATTDVHSVIPAYASLPQEEIGLIVTNVKQVAYRTVEGNLGMRVSATGVTNSVDPREILARQGIVDDDMAERLKKYCEMLERNTDYLPDSAEEKSFDHYLAQTAVEEALKRHAGHIVTEADPLTGAQPGMPVGRDLRSVTTVVAVGGYFAHRPEEETKEIVAKALSRRGISLLPEHADVVVDRDYLLFTAGVIGMHSDMYAFDLLRNYFIANQ